ncbi:MAG: hypothetical protein FWH16_02885 [Oscillospiraceae bacterium]|nr:hypothetical protein [Oscillospiraceae bacterium]
MDKRKWAVGVTAFLLVALLLAGFVAFASDTGSQADPAVSLSYITEEFQPAIMQKIDEIVRLRADEYAADMNRRINDMASQVGGGGGSVDASRLVDDAGFISAVVAAVIEQMPLSSVGGGEAGGMQRVDVKNGGTVTLEIGAEVVLRIGSATCVAGGTPGLIDLTTAGELANGRALEKNRLYLCTIAGRGFKATSDVTVFIRGGYTVSN